MRIFDQYHKEICDNFARIGRRSSRYLGLELNDGERENILRKEEDMRAGNIPLFDITNVTSDFAIRGKPLILSELFSMRLPFGFTWFEYMLPLYTTPWDKDHPTAKVAPRKLPKRFRGKRIGGFFSDTSGPLGYHWETGKPMTVAQQKARVYISTLFSGPPRSEDESPWLHSDEALQQVIDGMMESGELTEASLNAVPARTISGVVYNNFLEGNRLDRLYSLSFTLDEDGLMQAGSLCTIPWQAEHPGYYAPILWALNLLNCGNIEGVEMPNDKPLAKKQLRKGYRGHTYKSLQVKVPRKSRKSRSDRPEQPTELRGHLVRGHVKHYAKDAPLFGKFTGSWYWESQYRGDEEIGTVHKHYEVEKGKANG